MVAASAVHTSVAIWDAYKECKVCRFSEDAWPSNGVNCIAGDGSGRAEPGGGGKRGIVGGKET